MRAVLEEIRDGDRAQKYRLIGPYTVAFSVLWLCGPDRCPQVKVGDTGELVYRSLPHRGWYGFVRDGRV